MKPKKNILGRHWAESHVPIGSAGNLSLIRTTFCDSKVKAVRSCVDCVAANISLSTHDFSHVRRRRLRVVFSSCLLAQGYLVTVFVVQPDNEVSVAGGNDGLL